MTPSVLNPRDFVKYHCPQMTGLLEGCTDLLLCYDARQFDALTEELCRRQEIDREMDNVFRLKNCHVALVGRIGIGASAAVATCEELFACGIRRLITLGTAATIMRGIKIGEVIVCKKAYSDEGTSRHYFPYKRTFKATPKLAQEIHDRLNGRGIPCKLATAWTTDAPYRETHEKQALFVRKGAGVVEMETSALYMVAGYRGVESASVLVVGDSIVGSAWSPHFHEPAIRTTLDRIGRELLAFLSKSVSL
jgi:purine-nucleoside phosphorylase